MMDLGMTKIVTGTGNKTNNNISNKNVLFYLQYCIIEAIYI